MNVGRDPGPKLEVLHRRAQVNGSRHVPPLLFVHGGFVGAWCWAENFLGWFASRGWDCHAVSLRGHGGSEGHNNLHQSGIDDYVVDVRRVAMALPQPPVLVGHSMGGFVVQRYLERFRAEAAVLLAPVPATGLCGAGIALAATEPGLFVDLGLAHVFGRHTPGPVLLLEAAFGQGTASGFGRYADRVGDESHRAWFEMCQPAFIDVRRIADLPLTVIGGGVDRVIPPAFVRSAARILGTRAEILSGLGHALMLEPGWRDVAELVERRLMGRCRLEPA